MSKMFICSIEENTMTMCEKHSKVFEMAAINAGTPHTIYELDDEDTEDMKCMACDLQEEIARPKIIIP